MFKFTDRLFTDGKGPLYPLDGTLGGRQSRSRRVARKECLVSARIRTPDRPARSLVVIPNAVPRTSEISLHLINQLVFLMGARCVLCEALAGHLNVICMDVMHQSINVTCHADRLQEFCGYSNDNLSTSPLSVTFYCT